MLIDGIAASSALDRSGERLLVDGVDITSYEKQEAPLVYEHKSGSKGTAIDVVGRVLYGKKLLSKDDCDNERQKFYWNKVKMPCIYFVGRIRDGEGNVGADALAAEIRGAKKHKEPMILGVSIEGHTLDRDGHLLKDTVARALAVTYKPCNATCQIDEIDKSDDIEKSEHPEYNFLPGGVEIEIDDPELPEDLAKALEAGSYDAAPASLVQGAALQSEDLGNKKKKTQKVEALFRDEQPVNHEAAGNKLLAESSPTLERRIWDLRRQIIQALEGNRMMNEGELWEGGPQVKTVDINTEHGPVRAGRFMVLQGKIHHLEDPHKALKRLLPEGPLDAMGLVRLHALEASPQVKVSINHDLPQEQEENPEAPQAEPQAQEMQPTKPSPALAALNGIPPTEVYRYKRSGSSKDAVLEVSGDKAYVDGHEVPPTLVDIMLHNVQIGAATLEPASLRKSDEEEMDVEDAMHHIRAAKAAGLLHPDPKVADKIERAMTAHVFQDSPLANRGVTAGNKYAWEKFMKQGRPGAYIGLDINSFKHINDNYGHLAGDDAIVAYGKAVREAADETMGQEGKRGKVFRSPSDYQAYRPGGDEMTVHMPTYEHALKFTKLLHQKLNDLPPINGAHKLSASVGIGHDPATADKALYKAKEQKKTSAGKLKYTPGQEPNMAHSLFAGKEGELTLHHETPPAVHAPKLPGTPKESEVRPQS